MVEYEDAEPGEIESVNEPAEIEEGTTADLPAYVELLEEAGSWLWERGIEQWPPGSLRAQEPMLRSQIESGALVVARAGDRLAAGCVLTAVPYAAWQGRPGPAAYLHKLAVARDYAGRDLGARVVVWAEAWTATAGRPTLRLDCWDGSAPLRAYYRGLGFEELDSAVEHGYLVRLFEKKVRPDADFESPPRGEGAPA